MSDDLKVDWWRRGIGYIAICVVMICCGCLLCRWYFCPRPPAANLVIEDDDIAAWMSVNNTFTVALDANGNAIYDRDLRTGLLVQIGDYEHGDAMFGKVVLKKSGTVVKEYPQGTFTWINVISPWSAAGLPPMDANKHEYALYPNNVKVDGPCKNVDACADKAFECNSTAMGSLVGDCLRRRLLHTEFNFQALLTYWQGVNGYSLGAAQTVSASQPNRKRNAYQVVFRDQAFTVDVYKYGATPYLVDSYPAGAVTQIMIQRSTQIKGPNHGSHSSPPWPPPDL